MDPTQLRREMRARRRQLSRQTLASHGNQLLRLALNYKPFRQSRRIGFYLASKGEMDPSPLMKQALQSGKQVYLPVLRQRPEHGLWFAPFRTGDNLIPNRFGIHEPKFQYRRVVMPWALDMVFVPLVAFDQFGNRLGMGGGYYDHTFAYKMLRTHWKGPRLIGLAHEFQGVHSLPIEPWDIPLDAVLTEQQLHLFISTDH